MTFEVDSTESTQVMRGEKSVQITTVHIDDKKMREIIGYKLMKHDKT